MSLFGTVLQHDKQISLVVDVTCIIKIHFLLRLYCSTPEDECHSQLLYSLCERDCIE